jgi:hypothetical protein
VPHYGIKICTSVYFFYFLKRESKNGGKDVGDDGGDVTNVDGPMYIADVNFFLFFMVYNSLDLFLYSQSRE